MQQASGFLLLDSYTGLLIAGIGIGCGLFWQHQMLDRQHACTQRIQALSLARSIHDHLTQRRVFPSVSCSGSFIVTITAYPLSAIPRKEFVTIDVSVQKTVLVQLTGYRPQ